MTRSKKQIVMLALDNQAEALRMAAGLTLLDDAVVVMAIGALPQTPELEEQLDALSFSEVPVRVHDSLSPEAIDDIARSLMAADTVFVV